MARTTTVHLLTGDYADRLETLWAAANKALEDKAPRTLLDGDPYEALSEEYTALRANALEAATSVTLTAVGRSAWRALKAKHKPRFGDDVDAETAKQDRLAGVNVDTVEDDLVYASVTDPEFTSAAASTSGPTASLRGSGRPSSPVRGSWRTVRGSTQKSCRPRRRGTKARVPGRPPLAAHTRGVPGAA